MEKTYPVIDQRQIKMRWGDMDAIGHLNNTYYFRYLEQIRLDWLESIGHGIYLDGMDNASGFTVGAAGIQNHQWVIKGKALIVNGTRCMGGDELFQRRGIRRSSHQGGRRNQIGHQYDTFKRRERLG